VRFPHVRSTESELKEFVKTATSKGTEDLNAMSERAAKQAQMREASTQTSPMNEEHYYMQQKKDFTKKVIEKEIPCVKRIYQAAQAVKKAARKGVWDGTVVEEVFLEMTGVIIGDEEKMKSDWKN
jgi:predicted Zn-dependent protease